MTINEVSLFIEARKDVELEEWRRTRYIVWSVLQSQSRKKIKPENVFLIDGDNKSQAPRSEISKGDHLALVAKYNRIKAQGNGDGK